MIVFLAVWEFLKNVFLIILGFFIEDLSKPISLEMIFFLMNGILIFFAYNYISNARDSILKKILIILSVFVPWNIYYFTIVHLLLNWEPQLKRLSFFC